MLCIDNVTKKYDGSLAIENINFSVKRGVACGIVGYNGAGKTTLLKTICGVLIPDNGDVTLDSQKVFSSMEARCKVFFVTDIPYWLPQSNMVQMKKFYAGYYLNFNEHTFKYLAESFKLDVHKKLVGFSKGMQKQAALIFALSSGAEYLLLDELFDGLDPQMLEIVIKLLKVSIKENRITVVLASHNLPKVGQFCDRVILINGKSLVYDKDAKELLAASYKYSFVRDGESVVDDYVSYFAAKGIIVKGLEIAEDIVSFSATGNVKEVMLLLEAKINRCASYRPMTFEEIVLSDIAPHDSDFTGLVSRMGSN